MVETDMSGPGRGCAASDDLGLAESFLKLSAEMLGPRLLSRPWLLAQHPGECHKLAPREFNVLALLAAVRVSARLSSNLRGARLSS